MGSFSQFDRGRDLFDLFRFAIGVVDLIAGQVHGWVPIRLDPRHLHIFRDIDQHGPGRPVVATWKASFMTRGKSWISVTR